MLEAAQSVWVWLGWACMVGVVGCYLEMLRRSNRAAWREASHWQAKALERDLAALDFARKAVDLQRQSTRYLQLSVELRAAVVAVLDGDPRDAPHTAARIELRRALAAFDDDLYRATSDDAAAH